jgi:hypothetical protein
MRCRRKGSAVVEAALMMPWIAFLFVGVLDFGFYAYAAICTQNAARAVAISQASGSGANICLVALGEMAGVPNRPDPTTYNCPKYPSGVGATTPVTVCVATISSAGPDDASCSVATTCADCPLNAAATSIQATVAYQSIPMIPIPGILTNRLNLTRTAEARVIR